MQRNGHTFNAILTPAAARLNLQPQLFRITLANILSGDTCDPISLSDFEVYLAFREHALANLQFVVWFQDYRKRFFEIPEADQTHSVGSIHNNSRATEVVRDHRHSMTSASHTNSEDHWPVPPPQAVVTSTASPRPDATSPTAPSFRAPSPRTSSSSFVRSPNTDTVFASPLSSTFLIKKNLQSLQRECMRIVATFLQPGSPKQLPLDGDVRETCIRQLTASTHPDVFLPVYEEMYRDLESTILPRFLAHAATNLNLPLQLLWYALGAAEILIAIIMAVTLIVKLPSPPQSRRAWRTFPIVFAGMGAWQIYSAWRGFCSGIWLRDGVQLRTWELQEVDEEAKQFWDHVLVDLPDDDPNQPWQSVPPSPSEKSHRAMSFPDDSPPTLHHRRPSIAPMKISLPLTRNGFRRPPVFGPEKVVKDPRIKATHRKVVIDIFRVAFLFAVVFAAIIVPIPSPH